MNGTSKPTPPTASSLDADIALLTTLLAQELRRKAVNIRVNSIAPGIFPSEMTSTFILWCYGRPILIPSQHKNPTS